MPCGSAVVRTPSGAAWESKWATVYYRRAVINFYDSQGHLKGGLSVGLLWGGCRGTRGCLDACLRPPVATHGSQTKLANARRAQHGSCLGSAPTDRHTSSALHRPCCCRRCQTGPGSPSLVLPPWKPLTIVFPVGRSSSSTAPYDNPREALTGEQACTTRHNRMWLRAADQEETEQQSPQTVRCKE